MEKKIVPRRTDSNLDTGFTQNVQGGLGDKASAEHKHLAVEPHISQSSERVPQRSFKPRLAMSFGSGQWVGGEVLMVACCVS